MQTPDWESWSNKRILTLTALMTLVVSVVWRLPDEAAFVGHHVGELLVALTMAMALTYVLRPAVRGLVRVSGGDSASHRTKATLLVFLCCGFLIYLMFLVGFKPVVNDIRELMPTSAVKRQEMVTSWKTSIRLALDPYKDFLPADTLDDPKFFSIQMAMVARKAGHWLQEQSAHAGFLVELLLVPVLAFYFLADGPEIRHESRILFPPHWRPRMARMAAHFDNVLDGYVRGQAWMCIIAWFLTTVVLYALDVKHAVTLGLIAGLTRAVPVIGPLLGAIPLLFATLISTQSVQTTGILLLAFFVMHFMESKVLLPKVVGHHVDLHPVSVIISLLIGMEFFGFIGVFLAVPIAAVVKILLIEYHTARENAASPNLCGAPAGEASPPPVTIHSVPSHPPSNPS